MARREKQKALVVSSDRDIVQSAASNGAVSVSTDEFENKLMMSMDIGGIQIEGNDHDGWKPTTKKKGPATASKRQRKNSVKIRKL